MISKPRSVREAQTKLQALYLEPISDIAAALGVQLNNTKSWKPTSANRYTRKGERDAIIFPEGFEMLSSLRRMGDPIITDRESEWSLVQPINNDTPEPVEEIVKYSISKTENFLESESSTQGWHFESKTVTDVSASGSFMGIGAEASVHNETTIGASGQYDSASEKGHATSSAVDKTTKVTVPPHSTRIVEQYEESAKIKVPISDKNIFDIAFMVEDWKEYDKGSPLSHNKRKHSVRHSKTYLMLEIYSLEDLRDLLIGVNSDFPKQHEDLLDKSKTIRNAFDVLLDPAYRTVEIKGFQYFENSSTGLTRIKEGDHAFYTGLTTDEV